MTSTYTKTYELLTESKRRAALVLLGFIMVGTVFEVLGIGLLLPVISLLMSDDLASSYPVLQSVLNAMGNPDHEGQVKITLTMLVGVYVGKNIFLAFLAWWQARFSVGLQIAFAQILFALYLRQTCTETAEGFIMRIKDEPADWCELPEVQNARTRFLNTNFGKPEFMINHLMNKLS
jgi:hypothetical protein